MSRFRTPAVTAGPTLLLAVGLAVATSATAVSAPAAGVDPATGPDFEMPFLCGQAWTGTSRSYHSPSFYSIDWNRPDRPTASPLLASGPRRGHAGRAGRQHRQLRPLRRSSTTARAASTLYAHLKQILARSRA